MNKKQIHELTQSLNFPYMKTFIQPMQFYVNNLLNHKPHILHDPYTIDGVSLQKFSFIDKNLFNEENFVTIITEENDFKEMDIITNLFSEQQRMQAIVNKPNSKHKISPYNFWNTQKEKIVEYLHSQKITSVTPSICREALYNLIPEATLFKVSVALSVYDIFKPVNILDCCSGWGDRLIAACVYAIKNKNVVYQGYDPNRSLQTAYKEIMSQFNQLNFNVKCQPFEDSLINKNFYDLVFTSPPYFDFEIYTTEPDQSVDKYVSYKAWLVYFLFPLVKKSFESLKDQGYLILHISDTKNMPKVAEFIHDYILQTLSYQYIGCIATQAPKKRAHPMWVYKKVYNKSVCNTLPSYYSFFKQTRFIDNIKSSKTLQKSVKSLIYKVTRMDQNIDFDMCKDDLDFFMKVSFTNNHTERSKNKRVEDYTMIPNYEWILSTLDFGGADGCFASELQKEYQQNEVYSLDLKDWLSKHYESKYENVKYLYADLEDYNIPLQQESIMCITSIQVLHHVPNVKEVLGEWFRVLSNDGYIMIREHDCCNYEDELLIDLEHLLYEISLRKSVKALYEYKACYFSKTYLYEMLKDAGFVFEKDTNVNGITKCYNTIWRKPKRWEIVDDI
jgi:ubiquinone/menaquinone biosynthesis C-methylase UbiE